MKDIKNTSYSKLQSKRSKDNRNTVSLSIISKGMKTNNRMMMNRDAERAKSVKANQNIWLSWLQHQASKKLYKTNS